MGREGHFWLPVLGIAPSLSPAAAALGSWGSCDTCGVGTHTGHVQDTHGPLQGHTDRAPVEGHTDRENNCAGTQGHTHRTCTGTHTQGLCRDTHTENNCAGTHKQRNYSGTHTHRAPVQGHTQDPCTGKHSPQRCLYSPFAAGSCRGKEGEKRDLV